LLSQSATHNRQSAIAFGLDLPLAMQSAILDVGTGSGCIAIALAKELSQAKVWATDISPEALAVARENARHNGVAEQVRFLQGDLFLPIVGEKDDFNLIVANPPYIAQSELAVLQPEVRGWEPPLALDGGPDGLDFYRRLLHEGPIYLRAGGWLVMEIGHGQGEAVLRLAQERRDLSACRCIADYAGRERVIIACKGSTCVN
jgi:release factor glutamine methyltransferase